MAQPLDPGTFELAGDAFPVAERVSTSRVYALFTVSPGGALAYRTGGAASDTQLTWFDRAGKPLATLGALRTTTRGASRMGRGPPWCSVIRRPETATSG
jgi:hypothetical protein